MFQRLFETVVILSLADWLTQTNAYGFDVSRTEVAPNQNSFGNLIPVSSGTAGSDWMGANSIAGISQEQIDSQLSGLATGDVITINNVRYVALRTENDAGQTGRRDMVILVQVEGYDSSPGIDSFQSFASGVPAIDASVGTDRSGQSYNAPNNRQHINGAAMSVDASAGSYSAPYSMATNRQEVGTAFNGGAGVNDPSSSLSSYSSSTLMATNNRQSSAGQDHSSSYSYPTTSNSKILPTESGQYGGSFVETIPGVAGRDYPILSKVGASTFSCNGRREGGYYADVESSCQVYHVCALGKRFSFLCPNGTLFDQRTFVCQWWFDVDCTSSANYYNLNNLIGIARVVKNGVSFASDGQPATFVSSASTKPIYGPPPLPVLIGPAIKRPSDTMASTSTY